MARLRGRNTGYTVHTVRVWRLGLLVATAVAVLAVAGTAAGQFGRRGGRSRYMTVPLATRQSFDGRFNYCRVYYRNNPYGQGGGWATDYPESDINFSIRLSELTKTNVAFDGPNQPRHLVVRLTDDELYRCPFVMMLEVGMLYLDEMEAARLRDYLLKGGFLWVDDFWGTYEWQVWQNEIEKVFSPGQYPIVDIPPDHVLYNTVFPLEGGIPQVPSINTWFRGATSERGADSAEVHTRAILDESGRIMVLMTHNTDISDSWEREAYDPRYFYEFSVQGYAVGINILMYAMTH